MLKYCVVSIPALALCLARYMYSTQLEAKNWTEPFDLILGSVVGAVISILLTWYTMDEGKRDMDRLRGNFHSEFQNMQDLTTNLRTEVDRFEQETASHLGNLSRNLGEQVLQIQDATRRLLTDFPDIFLKARELVEEADKRLWVLNFTPCFGHVHAYNRRFMGEYATLVSQGKLSLEDQHELLLKQVMMLTTDVEGKSEYVTDFRLAMVDPVDFLGKFLEPLFKKVKADEWYSPPAETEGSSAEHIMNAVLKRHQTATVTIQTRCEDKPNRLVFLDRVPLQMFIADKKGEHDKGRCVVFFIGSDNLASEKEIKGLYTEFPDLIRLFTGVFEGIVRDHAKAQLVTSPAASLRPVITGGPSVGAIPNA
jgi:hypothetical protein